MGYDIGSHGLYHRDLTTLCDRELETEVSVSKKLIEDCIGAPINAFSYPWGVYGAREQNAVQEAGYDCAVIVGSNWENGPETDCFRLQRKTMCRKDSMTDFAHKVCGHEQFYRGVVRVLHKCR
jgi:peptidoglycan/xylan/chitin deacetylase (PgdA/CDA1 family)